MPFNGTDPILWRNQIRNWPYLLKIKGTALSLEVFLHLIDVDDHKLYTFFRDAEGNLVENKPDGEPFEKDGLWYNIRTHYFDLDLFYYEGHYLSWEDWHDDFLRSINIWFTRLKPFHAELRNLNVFINRADKLHIIIGLLGIEGIHHHIDFNWNFSANDSHSISVGTIVNSGTHQNVDYAFNFSSDDLNRISIGAITNQSAYHNIDNYLNFSVDDVQNISLGSIVNSGSHHNVKIRL